MADVEDVSDALVSLIGAYLSGNDPASVVTPADFIASSELSASSFPLTGAQTDVFSGWPLPDELKAALGAGGVQISIYPIPGSAAQRNRHMRDWQRQGPSNITTIATINAGLLYLSGSIVLPLNASVTIRGVTVNYAAVLGETLESLAENIAAGFTAAGIQVSVAGSTLTFDDGDPIKAALGGQGFLIREAAREEQIFQITVWAPTRALRRDTAKAFEGPLMSLDRFGLPDTSVATLRFMKVMINDHSELENCYRRDLWFRVEYPYTEIVAAYDITAVPIIETVASDSAICVDTFKILKADLT